MNKCTVTYFLASEAEEFAHVVLQKSALLVDVCVCFSRSLTVFLFSRQIELWYRTAGRHLQHWRKPVKDFLKTWYMHLSWR